MTEPATPTDTSFVATRLPALVGAGFGLLFVLLNAGGLPVPWPLPVRIAGLLLTAVAAGRVLLARLAPAPRPRPEAMRTYWRWVGIEAVAIFAGTALLGRLGLGEYGVLWVIAMVGVHFLPFATAFARPAYARLGWVLLALTLLGLVLAALVGPAGAALAGVGAGAVLLLFAVTFGTGERATG